MNIVVLSYHYKLDYIIDVLTISTTHKLIAIIADNAYYDALKKDNRCLDNQVEIVHNLFDISNAYDSIIYFVDDTLSPKENIDKQLDIARICGKNIIKLSYNDYILNKELELKLINVPIVTISKTNKHIKSLKFIYSIYNKIKSDSFNATIISNDCFSEFMGFNSFPDILFSDISISQKIAVVNNYIYNIVGSNTEQILIIDIPGDINDEYIYIIQQALRSDYNIVLTEAFRCFNNYWNILESNVKEVFFGPVTEIVVSEYVLDFIPENSQTGLPITEKSLKRLCGSKVNVFDIDDIYFRIKDRFTNPSVIG